MLGGDWKSLPQNKGEFNSFFNGRSGLQIPNELGHKQSLYAQIYLSMWAGISKFMIPSL